jgi:hypothetical protein
VKYVLRRDGADAIADDMAPHVRAFAFLVEHANQRRDDRLPLPCPCIECGRHRASIRLVAGPGETLIVEPA